MKSLLTGVVCSSLLLLAGCNDSATTTESSAAVETQKTVLASGIERANMNTEIRPQDDFYMHINGGWLDANAIPADKTSIGSFYDLRDKSDDDVNAIIEELAAAKNLTVGTDEQKVADLFSSFMDTEKLNALGIKPIEPFLAEVAALASKDDLAKFFAKAQKIGLDSPLYYYVSVDAKNSSTYAGHVWHSGLGLPDRDYYFKEDERFVEMRAAYVAHIAKMFELAGQENPQAAAETIMALETKMAKLHWTRVQTRDSEKRYNKFATSDLKNVTNNFNWTVWLETLGVSDQQNIILNQPDFVAGFGDIVANTDMATWKTFLNWQVIGGFASNLSEDIAAQSFDFYGKTINGQQEQKPRWKRGVSLVNGNLGEVIGKVYVKRHFPTEAKGRMTTLVENLRSAYGESIDALEWMSGDTKKAARVKLAAFTPKIGYPDRWEDYSAIEISADDLIANLISADADGFAKGVAKLGGPIHTWEWGMTPQTVNAYYNPTVNEIVFPAAILQPPFFNLEADEAVNYGGIGAVIGHEMGHGFDDQGSKYDAEGNMKNWWTEQDLAEFKKRSSQLVEQYNGYSMFGDAQINGELTLGENIGDLSGLTIAYRAYQNSLNGAEAPVIDGLTGDQRFFMGYAQIWRQKHTEKAQRERIATDSHSPGHFRALGSLSNMNEFYEAYGIKEGDKMYIAPEKRVKIW
ncbi:M13 family metallopeptidase [Thalassotalea sp. ND16A]|uniref:M13 family metallopeptidase n=1 Tax=Thalassotalea sp. ND16A TaxID=1535422 RepID=UPI00051A178B|nr:M13-type metalloendopeptidase [Thalassotalea sp. ND16A]KGJ97154.1 Endothelin-converting enzyme 1 [Thalassotalea sp. ND16A]